MKLFEIEKKNHIDDRDIEDWLSNLGFQVDDREFGMYAFVYFHRTRPIVAKVWKRDPCYEAFLQFIRARKHNKFLPKLSGTKRVFSNNEYWQIVFIEKLQPLAAEHIKLDYELGKAVDHWFTYGDVEGYDWLEEQWPGLLQTLVDLHKFMFRETACEPDLHDENIMLRSDGTPVIIDPMSMN